MSSAELIPIRGSFEDPKTFLHHIASDDEIKAFVIFIVKKDGDTELAQIKMTRGEVALAALQIAKLATEPE